MIRQGHMEQGGSFPVWILILILFSLVGNVLALSLIGILPDEAYYWVWSQRFELSYYDHPPLIAWMMWPFTFLFGNEAWAARLPSVLSWILGAVLAWQMAQRIFGGHAGALAVLVWSSLPIIQVGFHIITPDTPLMIFAWLSIWYAWRAGNESSPALWAVTGVMAGLAMLAKYPAVLVIGAVFLALLTSRQGRNQLVSPWPWLGVLIAGLVYLPVIIWNAQYDWVSFAFQFSHGVKTAIEVDHLRLFSLFIGGQLVVAMPWTFLAMLISSSRLRFLSVHANGYTVALLFWSFWLPLLVFGIAGLTSLSGPNWPITAYAAGTVLLAGSLNQWLRRGDAWRKSAVMAIVVVFVATVLLVNLMRFPHWVTVLVGENFTQKRTQLSQNYGWEKLRPELKKTFDALPENCLILADNHARAGMLAWLLNEPKRVTTTRDSRYSQYDLWREKHEAAHIPCLYFAQYDHEFVPKSSIPDYVGLTEGRAEQVRLITAENPDLSLRWFVLFRFVNDESTSANGKADPVP